MSVAGRGRGSIVVLTLLLLAAPARAQSTALDLMRRAAAYERAGNPQAALEAYAALLQQHASDRLAPVAAYAAANLHGQALRDTSAAIRGYERVVREHGAHDLAAEAARRMAECLQGRKQWTEAGDAYARALELAGHGAAAPPPDWINAVALGVADCYYQLGDRDRVIEAYRRVLEGPAAPQPAAAALYRLADAYEARGEEANAAAAYARVVEEFPFAGVFDQAVAKRELIDRHRTLDWEPYLTYARTSRDFARRDYAAVPPRCDSVLARSPNAALRACAEMRKIVAETQATGNFISGTRRLTALLDGLPDPRTMPNAERQLEQFRAMADAERRAADRPNDAAAQTALGALFLQLGLPARALGPLELAVKLAPEDAQARLYFGYACNAAGRAPEAVEAFRFYLERNPADTNALNQIGYALLAQGQAEEALPYFRRYAELAPEDPNAHDSLGEGLLNAGRLEDAAAEYETAVRLNPDFANSHFMLGEVSRRLGRTERAVAAYRRFLDLGPDGRQADEARTALEQLGAK